MFSLVIVSQSERQIRHMTLIVLTGMLNIHQSVFKFLQKSFWISVQMCGLVLTLSFILINATYVC